MAEEDEKKHHYSVKNKGFNMFLDGDHVQAKNSVFSLTQRQHEELQKLIKKGDRNDLTQELKYIDMDAAAKIAAEHMAQNNRAQAHQGMAGSNANAERVNANSTLKVVEPKDAVGATLLGKLKASAENIKAMDNPQNPDNVKPFTVTESDAVHAADIAPALPETKK